MTTYHTRNPLGSKDPRDLYDNAENYDTAMNDRTNEQWTDRFDVHRPTWFGIEERVSRFLANSGFELPPLTYIDGSPLQVDRATQLIERGENLYSIKLPASFPIVLSGTWGEDEPFLIARVDQALRQELAVTGGAGIVGFDPGETYSSGSVGENLKSLQALRKIVVTDYGAVGDGVTDDTTAIQAAIAAAGIGSDVEFPNGTYLITDTLVQLQSQRWLGRGGQRGTTIKKGANIDMVLVGSLGTILDINLEGNGANFSGKGFRIPAGFSQTIERCRAVNMGGEPLYFDNNAGGGANVSTFEGYPTDTTTYAGIAIAGDTGPHPRFFRGIWLSGANFALGPGAGNGGSMTGFYIRDLRYDATSTLFHISNGRCATLGETTTLRGFDHTLDGVAFAGPVALESAQGINIGSSCTVPSLIENPTNCQYNSVHVQRRTYTPTWSQTSATPAVGNGSLTGDYIRHGYECKVEIELTAGSSTTFGDSASAWRFSLPFPGHLSRNQRALTVYIYDSSTNTDFVGKASIGAGQNYITISIKGQQVREGYPMVWAEGDTLQASFSYMVR
ncbi:TPA: glycosyl hydrolase family 28-related protein [Pseudomonas aeruginosa]